MEFASRMTGLAGEAPRGDTVAADRPEIAAGAVVIRLGAGAPAGRTAPAVRAPGASG